MYPSQFIELLQKVVEHPKALLDAFSNSLLPSYRINSAKSNKPLSENDIPLGYASSAYRCAQDVDFTAEPNLHRGAFYVQEASSIFLEHVLQQLGIPTDSKVLDMCAAPGGKSLILSDYFKQGLVF
jgi:16S rRNA C967 or C1407 C5-methylase (RsmB/RsmF family)